MWCAICQKELSKCTCPDIKERIEAISRNPNIATKWCMQCDNHYSQCKCEEPKWVIRTGHTLKKI